MRAEATFDGKVTKCTGWR